MKAVTHKNRLTDCNLSYTKLAVNCSSVVRYHDSNLPLLHEYKFWLPVPAQIIQLNLPTQSILPFIENLCLTSDKSGCLLQVTNRFWNW
jgi:hypothetical protein